MAREMDRLSARAVATITKHGRHSDGGGLYLSISPNGGRRWTFLYRWRGKPTELGFGSARKGHVTLARARELATEARAQIAKGVNPKDARKPAEGATFGEVADGVIEAMKPKWRNEKSAAAWEMTLGKYCFSIRRNPVADVTVDQVLEVLKPIWGSKPETANRLRGRIEMVLDAARAQGLRFGENPARWRGHLDHLLPKRSKRTRGHHAAMPYEEIAGFMVDLRARDDVAARALEFTILCAARTGEVLGMRWPEVDLEKGVWAVPANRMKGEREHRVPLSGRALEILREMHKGREGDFVFPGQNPGKPLGPKALKMVLVKMKIAATVHGFRSSFRDWAGNETGYPRDLIETALAHLIGDQAEQAYRRSDALEKRRGLMETWAYCSTPQAGKVVQLRRA
ncbi:MAG TPA: integrase arm-type DNA-binding domain-containing protein [Methylocella sp.]|nr:integrase arm-type DNA-binding domain-containing protein [Methylocella sp.]